MKVAIAQIDMRLGDIEGICDRVHDQARIAADAGAHLLCVPAPLITGCDPGSLSDYAPFERRVLASLHALSQRLEPVGTACLISAEFSLAGTPFWEVFLLREGNLTPLRLTAFHQRMGTPVNPWLPPTFDLLGTRVAVTFDFKGDVGELPPGCDLLVYFQLDPFDATDPLTVGAAAVLGGCFSSEAARAGVWLACVAPVGGFDEAVYTGASFVMDDCGRVVAAAPPFSEALVVQEVRRGMPCAPLEARELPRFDREVWTLHALALHLRDTLAAHARSRCVVRLDGDAPSSLIAAIAVEAVGPRNVTGVLVHRDV